MTGVLAVAVLTLGSAPAEPPSYGRDVRPFLDRYCRECHREKRARAGFRLDTFEALSAGRTPAVVPGEPDKSPLLRVMTGRGRTMPPRGWDQPTPAEVEAVRAWVRAGAAYAPDAPKPPGWAVKTSFRLPAAATALAVGPEFIAAGTAAGGVTVWDARTLRESGTLDPEKTGGRVGVLALADGGKALVSVHGPNVVGRWAGERFAPVAKVGGVRLVGLTPDGTGWLATPADNPARLGLYPTRTGRDPAAPTFAADAGGPVTWAAATPDGRHILATARVPSEPGEPVEVRLVCWTRDGERVWVARRPAEADGPSAAAVAPDGAVAAFAGPTGPISLIDMKTGKFVLTYAPHDPALPDPTARPDPSPRNGDVVRAGGPGGGVPPGR